LTHTNGLRNIDYVQVYQINVAKTETPIDTTSAI